MRIDLDTLVSTDPPMTAERQILAAIRQGVYPWVAAEAAGVSREQFQLWLKSNKRRYRRFAVEVRKAQAQARMQAEMALFSNDPRSWLKSGPGREANGEPGWSKEVPPHLDKEPPAVHPLEDPAWRELFDQILAALAPYPEARAALAEVLRAQSASR
ncbi:MAG TPA: hypothetical protein VNK04_21660 [Gemmataceae bacterium]|nr:hypothetical protein [Gemmataceae bacterium]